MYVIQLLTENTLVRNPSNAISVQRRISHPTICGNTSENTPEKNHLSAKNAAKDSKIQVAITITQARARDVGTMFVTFATSLTKEQKI